VGFKNYKFFLLVLLYAMLSTGLMLAALSQRFVKVFSPVLDAKYFMYSDLPIAVAFLVCCVLFLALFTFLCFHLYLTAHAMSTIEYREKKNHDDISIKHRWAVSHYKYDLGAYENLCHVFGKPWMWLFPVDSRPRDDGTYSGKVLSCDEYEGRYNNQRSV